jgi:hypothetical protein
MDAWFTLLQDWAHDAGAHLCWGTRQVAAGGTLGTKHWVNLQLPDKVIEHLGPSLNTAAWCVMAEVEPDPLDRPEA